MLPKGRCPEGGKPTEASAKEGVVPVLAITFEKRSRNE